MTAATVLEVVWVGTYPVFHRVALPEVASESLRCFNAFGLPLRSLEGLEIAAFLLLFLDTLGMVTRLQASPPRKCFPDGPRGLSRNTSNLRCIAHA